MDISNTSKYHSTGTSVGHNAQQGIQTQIQKLERNAAQIAQSHSSETPTKAIAEQTQIVAAVKANALSLDASNEQIGTLLDIKV